jgi:phosphoribosyl 1,2-cyclic phosphate phosphodiesterase
MELLLLGTAAAECWPSAWCTCTACTGARRHGGRDIRTRSGALLDGVVKVDFGPDTLMQMQQARRDLTTCTTLVFTHAHDDHFTPGELQYRGPGFVPHMALPTLDVYGNQEITGILSERYGSQLKSMHMELHEPLRPLERVVTPDGTGILPLSAAHDTGALLLRLTRQGRHIFYGHDSGIYPDETIQALAGTPLDLVLFDCTHGSEPSDYKGHLGIPSVLEMAERLRTVGAITAKTMLVATHFSHNGSLLYDDLIAQFAPHGIRVSYDGLILDI